jgi:hypothetical protein
MATRTENQKEMICTTRDHYSFRPYYKKGQKDNSAFLQDEIVILKLTVNVDDNYVLVRRPEGGHYEESFVLCEAEGKAICAAMRRAFDGVLGGHIPKVVY